MIHHPTDRTVWQLWNKGVADPAAGSSWSYTIPNRMQFELNCCQFQIDTDVNAANRKVRLSVVSGIYEVCSIEVEPVIAANVTRRLTFARGLGTHKPTVNSTYIHNPWPTGLILNGGMVLTCSVDGIQAGDQLSSIQFLGRAWLDFVNA